MVGVQVDRTGTLTRAQLVGVGEGVLVELHDRDDTGGLVLDVLDRRTGGADVGQVEGHAAAALGQLQGGVDGAADGLHVVLEVHQEAGDQLAALLLASVEEGRGGGLEALGHHLVHEELGLLLVAAREEEGCRADAVLPALQVALAVEGLQRIGGVELVGADEGLEAELLGIRLLVQGLDEVEVIPGEELGLVVVVLDEVVQLLLQGVEEDHVLVGVLEEVGADCLLVLVELDPTVLVEPVHLSVEGDVVLGQVRGDSLGSLHGCGFVLDDGRHVL